VLELVAQELLGFEVPWAGGPARPNGHKLAGVLQGLGAVEVLLGGKGKGREQKQGY
jgi:hypothetical protein